MKKIYIFFYLGTLLLSSCENLIEVDAPNNQLGTPQVFEDVQTANAALSGLYAELRDQSVISGAGYYAPATLLASYVDNFDCYYTSDPIMAIYQNQQQETNTIIKSIWGTAYSQIYYANSIIYGTEQSVALSDTDKNRIKGEALFMRALLYFYLQRLFGDIPYTTSIDYKYNRNLNKTKATALLEILENDCAEAVSLLEDDYRTSERIYPNRKTAQLLLARIYLLRKEWALAEQTAQDILQSPLYVFQEDINEVFHKSGKHILWQLKPENSGDATVEAGFYYFDNVAPNAYVLSTNLMETFSENDLRKQLWMAEVTFNDESWFRPYKYKNRSGNSEEYSVIFRLEEVYFIMAEALINQNRINEALPYLNATRERAGLTALNTVSNETFVYELLKEERREFFAEFGHRFLDLKRWDKLNELKTLKPNWEDYKQVWPIPQDELLLNSNLIPQNTGY